MYVRLPMVKSWNEFLTLLAEIRKALAIGKEEIDRAFNRPPTITQEEFDELRTLTDEGGSEKDPENVQWNALCAKLIDWDHVPFWDPGEDWSMNVGPDATLDYSKQRNDITLRWNEEWEATHIVPLLMRISLIFPADTRVAHSHLLVSKSAVLSKDGSSIEKDVDFECSGLEVEDYLLSFALHTASVYHAALYWEPGTKKKRRVYNVPDTEKPME